MNPGRRILTVAVGAALVAALLDGCGVSAGGAGPTIAPASATRTTTARATAIPGSGATAPGPGSGPVASPTPADGAGDSPQTPVLPDPEDGAFRLRVEGLWRAIVTDDVATALPLFFPLDAYRQVKAISDPDGDYQSRLIAAYRQDIHAAHKQIGVDATFDGVDVPTRDASWIEPGVEYNKGSYWRVYGTKLRYAAGGEQGTVAVTSMISWRGQWYVVHLGAIR